MEIINFFKKYRPSRHQQKILFMVICAVLLLAILTQSEETVYYKYTYKLTFCDGRPARTIQYIGWRETDINQGTDSHPIAVPEFNAGRMYYNVCEAELLNKELWKEKK